MSTELLPLQRLYSICVSVELISVTLFFCLQIQNFSNTAACFHVKERLRKLLFGTIFKAVLLEALIQHCVYRFDFLL